MQQELNYVVMVCCSLRKMYVIRVIIGLYLNNFVRVAWNGVMSEYLLAVNGVKQGGVLSPIIFSVYVDGLLVRLHNSGVGCYIGMQFVGVLAYADDLTLLAPSPTAMRKLLRICDEYAYEYSIVFNANKSKCLVVRPANRKFCGCDDIKPFNIGGSSVEFVTSFVHLSHVIYARMDDELDVKDACCKFIGQTNNVLCFFSSLTGNSVLKYRLFRAYCSDIYGCELWRIDDSVVDSFCVKWLSLIHI